MGKTKKAAWAICLAIPLVLSLLTVGQPVRSAAGASATCENLDISEIKARGDDGAGNVAANAIDNDLGTRWSNMGVRAWIRADLGEEKEICKVAIAWYKGDYRVYSFAISVSNDNVVYTKVYNGKSSSATLSSETYDFADVNARYVKINVYGNTENNWASITEIDVYGNEKETPASSTPDPATTPYRAMVLPYISVEKQSNMYSSKLRDLDMVVLRVGAGTTVSEPHLKLVRDLPGKKKGLEFRSIAEIKSFLAKGDKQEITFIGYVPEPEHGTPQAEMDNIVQSVKDASKIAHNAGLKFEIVPRLDDNRNHAADFAPYVDYYTIMGQSFQDDGTSSFKSFISSIANGVKTDNPKIELIFAEVSTERNPTSGLTLQETFRKGTDAVVGTSVDGASIWYNTDAQLQEVKDYLSWYNTKYTR